jgi:hypothetical protein
LQTSNQSKAPPFPIKPWTSVKLSTWWLPQTSGYSYLRVAAIRIDVHPAGENPTNMTCTLHTSVHVRLTYTSCGRSPYVATFHEPSTEWRRATAPEKMGSRHNPQHASWPICGSVSSFSPKPTNEIVGAKSSIYRWYATSFIGPISPTYDQYIQYLLAGPTHRSLTNTGGGYNFGGAVFPHTTPRYSQPAVSPFHLRACLISGYQTTHYHLTKGRLGPKSHEWEPPLDFYRNI